MRLDLKFTHFQKSCGIVLIFPSVPIEKLKFTGGFSEGVTPVPIPNTEVKTFSADDTAPEAVWESRSSPVFIYTKRALLLGEPFFIVDSKLGSHFHIVHKQEANVMFSRSWKFQPGFSAY